MGAEPSPEPPPPEESVHREWARHRAREGPVRQEDAPEDPHPTFHVYGWDHVREGLEHPDVVLADVYHDLLREVMGKGMHTTDPPEHTDYRERIEPVFRESVREFTRDSLESRATEVWEEFRGEPRVNLVERYTAQVPFRVLGDLLGLPSAHEPRVREVVRAYSRAFKRVQRDPGKINHLKTIRDQLREYYGGLVRSVRRASPRNNLLSRLVHRMPDGEEWAEEAIVSFLLHLGPAATDSTSAAAGMMLYGLLTHRDQLEFLRQDPSRVSAAAEEGLRWEAPFSVLDRKADEDLTLGSTRIPEGSRLLLHVAAANRDPDRFEDPHEFELQRPDREHLTFAGGPHLCLGRHLARREIQAMLRVLLREAEEIQLAPGEAETIGVRGRYWRSLPELPVSLGEAARTTG